MGKPITETDLDELYSGWGEEALFRAAG